MKSLIVVLKVKIFYIIKVQKAKAILIYFLQKFISAEISPAFCIVLLVLTKLLLTDEVNRIDGNHLEDKADSINIHADQLKKSAKSVSAIRK
jgi:hypothetical protein